MRISADQNRIQQSNKMNSFNRVEAIFMPCVDTDNLCGRCFYADKECDCSRIPCRSEDRHDNQNGYFRAANYVKIEYRYEH